MGHKTNFSQTHIRLKQTLETIHGILLNKKRELDRLPSDLTQVPSNMKKVLSSNNNLNVTNLTNTKTQLVSVNTKMNDALAVMVASNNINTLERVVINELIANTPSVEGGVISQRKDVIYEVGHTSPGALYSTTINMNSFHGNFIENDGDYGAVYFTFSEKAHLASSGVTPNSKLITINGHSLPLSPKQKGGFVLKKVNGTYEVVDTILFLENYSDTARPILNFNHISNAHYNEHTRIYKYVNRLEVVLKSKVAYTQSGGVYTYIPRNTMLLPFDIPQDYTVTAVIASSRRMDEVLQSDGTLKISNITTPPPTDASIVNTYDCDILVIIMKTVKG